MHPGVGAVRCCAKLIKRINRAGVDIAGLDTENGLRIQRRQGVRSHSPLPINRNTDHPVAPQAQEA